MLNQSIEIGAIFYCSWGYDQTNIDYYQVVKKKGNKTILVKKIQQKVIENDSYRSLSCKVIADVGNFANDDEISVRLHQHRHDTATLIGRFYPSKGSGYFHNLYPDNGQPKTQSYTC